MKKLKLYTLRSLLIPENRKRVFPLLFDLHYFEKPDASVMEHFGLEENPEQADFFVFPIEYMSISLSEQKQFDAFLSQAKRLGKKVMVYTGGDYGKTFRDKNIITWRNAGFKTTNSTNTVIVPAFINDPLERNGISFFEIPYKSKPEISFTGFATSSFQESFRTSASNIKKTVLKFLNKNKSDLQKFYNAAGKRATYLKQLEFNDRVTTHFIYRDQYRAGATSKQERETTTNEFYKNLIESPYTFCLRGAGNFSIRFYESLACGRIPVLVDTDVALPLEHNMNWDAHICRVSPYKNISEQLIDFHKNLDKNSFVKLQRSNRALYENQLVRHHFFCSLHETLTRWI